MEFLRSEMVHNFINSFPDGKMFSVTFEKKDGTLRRMVCRQGVKAHLKGGESTIKEHRNLVSVFDTEAGAYRCFDAHKVVEIHGGGGVLKVADEITDPVFNARGEEIKRDRDAAL